MLMRSPRKLLKAPVAFSVRISALFITIGFVFSPSKGFANSVSQPCSEDKSRPINRNERIGTVKLLKSETSLPHAIQKDVNASAKFLVKDVLLKPKITPRPH